MIDLDSTFIAFFAVIDPIGTVPVFVAVTGKQEPRERNKIALLATLVSAGILLFFVVAGEFLLKAMNIPLPAFQIAGGIVLFLFALSMIFGDSKPEEEMRMAQKSSATAIYPLAVPSVAGPGAMLAAVLMTENSKFSNWEQTQITAMMLAVLVVTYVLMRFAGRITRLIGESGASVVSRVMGLILASVATTNTLAGISEYFGLHPA